MLNSWGKSKIISLNPAIKLQLEAKFNGVHLTNYKFGLFSFAWMKKIQSRINLQSAHLLLYSGQDLFSTLGREFQMLSFTAARDLRRSYLLFLPLLTAVLTAHGRQKAGVACYSKIPLRKWNCQGERWRGWIDLNQLLLFHPVSSCFPRWKRGKIWQFITPLIHNFWNTSFCHTWLGQSLRLIKPVLWVILLHKDGVIPQLSPSQISEVKSNLIL